MVVLMRILKPKKLTALLLALVMLIGTAVPAFAADDAEDGELLTVAPGDKAAVSDDGLGTTLAEISDEYALVSYEGYKTKYGYSEDARTGKTVSVKGTDYMTEDLTAHVDVKTWEGEECACVGDTGSISWKLDIPETGWYALSVRYCALTDKTTDIERVFKLNGKSPFSEGRYQKFVKTWAFAFKDVDPENNLRPDSVNGAEKTFVADALGNELRPDSVICYEWSEYSFRDSNGYYNIPLEFYMEAGENVFTLEGVRDSIAVSEIKAYSYEPLKTYEEVLAEYEKKGYKAAEAENIKLEAELPDVVSNYTIYPIYDRSSAISSPQDKSKIYRNTIGGDKWTASGQWVRYSFTCEATGLYQIEVRFIQDVLKGMYTSRSIRINGEYPFEEAKNCQFAYDNDFQNTALNDGNYESFAFYFEEGKTYEIEFEVTLGSLSDVVRRVSAVVDSLNNDYMKILELAGSDPDEYRDYGFARIMPDVVRDLSLQAGFLYTIVDFITEMNGIKSDNTSTLEQAAAVVEKMASDENEIAGNLDSMKEWISSLGTWLSDVTTQFLEVDYITISPYESELQRGEANGWKSFWFEIQKFIASFYTDYNSIGAMEGTEEDENAETLTVWTTSGRDQAQIIKNLINNGYTQKTGVNVTLKLVAAGTLLPAILAGTGPDVSIDATNPIDFAIRGAVISLNDFDTFDDVMSRFADSAMTAVSIYGLTYAVPVTQSFPVMFVRNDIVSELGLEIPETWDDLLSMVPVLQFNNMDIGMTTDSNIFLYQNGGHFWRDEGMTVNLDSYLGLDTFESMCNMFTQYSLPVAYNAQNCFKTGEMPVIISDYAFYNTLVVFAPEISGLWSFYQIPGTARDDGTVDHTTVSTITGIIIPRGCSDEEAAWSFADWYSDKEFQVDYSNEMMALLGPSAKQSVANISALEELPWSESEYKVLQKCIQDTIAVEPYPGNYYTSRYTGFAFNAAYNEGADPSDTLLGYIDSINKELTRKRTEFELMVNDEWQAIKEYMGFEEFSEWREYWSKEQNVPYASRTCIQDNQEGADDYTYVDWMKDHNVTASNFESWQKAVKNGETCTYKEWVSE